MSAAVSIQLTPQGVRSVVVEQELIYFIGPCPTNPLADFADFERRMDDVRPLLAGEPRHAEFVVLVSHAYGRSMGTLATSLRQGGMHGHSVPNLCIDLVQSQDADGDPFFTFCDPHQDIQVIRGLRSLLNAEWVEVWWTGSLGHARMTCRQDGSAYWISPRGKREEL